MCPRLVTICLTLYEYIRAGLGVINVVRPDSNRWIEVTPSEHAHERGGLATARTSLNDTDPYREGDTWVRRGQAAHDDRSMERPQDDA